METFDRTNKKKDMEHDGIVHVVNMPLSSILGPIELSTPPETAEDPCSIEAPNITQRTPAGALQ